MGRPPAHAHCYTSKTYISTVNPRCCDTASIGHGETIAHAHCATTHKLILQLWSRQAVRHSEHTPRRNPQRMPTAPQAKAYYTTAVMVPSTFEQSALVLLRGGRAVAPPTLPAADITLSVQYVLFCPPSSSKYSPICPPNRKIPTPPLIRAVIKQILSV